MAETAKTPASVWIGRVLSVLVVLFMLMDGVMKLAGLPIVYETSGQLGWGPETIRPLGIILLICTALYAFPRTSVLGGALLTAYLGGAVATHMRVGSPLFSHTLFGVYLGLMLWGGLYLRDAGLRAVFPLRR
jgi:hypothetical protein